MAHPVRKPTDTEAEFQDQQALRDEALARSRNPSDPPIVAPRPFEPANTQSDPANAVGRGMSPGAIIVGVVLVLALIGFFTLGQQPAQGPAPPPAAQTEPAPATPAAPAAPATTN